MIGDHLIVAAGTNGEARHALSDVVAIGEHTDESGPQGEDYWLTLVLRDGCMLEIGSEDPASEAWYHQLGMRLAGAPFLPGLCDRTSFASRILWPDEHLGAPLLTFTAEASGIRSEWSPVVRKLIADGGYAC